MIVMTITKLHRYLGHPCNRNIPAWSACSQSRTCSSASFWP
jgi:hypothetical protein